MGVAQVFPGPSRFGTCTLHILSGKIGEATERCSIQNQKDGNKNSSPGTSLEVELSHIRKMPLKPNHHLPIEAPLATKPTILHLWGKYRRRLRRRTAPPFLCRRTGGLPTPKSTPKRTPKRPQIDPKSAQNRAPNGPKSSPNRPPGGSGWEVRF